VMELCCALHNLIMKPRLCQPPQRGISIAPHGLHMNNGVRSPWPALRSGTREGGKPRDNSAATLSQTGVDRPDLIPMLTQGTCDDGP
jgi:hypothetical protein